MLPRLWTEHHDAMKDYTFHCPDIVTMHQFAYSLKDCDVRSLRTQLIIDYVVDSGCISLLHVRDLNFGDATGNTLARELCQRHEGDGDSDADDPALKASNALLKSCRSSMKTKSKSTKKNNVPVDDEPTLTKKRPRVAAPDVLQHDHRQAVSQAPGNGCGGSGAGHPPVPAAPPADDNSSGSDSGSDDDSSGDDLETQQLWLENIDLQDPQVFLGTSTEGVAPMELNDGLSYQNDKGYVYEMCDTEANHQLGTITEMSAGKPNHAFKIYCCLHARCQIIRPYKTLPPGAEVRARKWIMHGYNNYKLRHQASDHMKDIYKFF